MTKTQPNRRLYVVFRHLVMSSKVFLQFGKEMKIRRAKSDLYDGWSKTVKPRLRNSAVIHKSMCSRALKQRQPLGMNFQRTTPLTPLKIVSMTLPGHSSILNFFFEEYSCLHKQLSFADECRSEAHFLPITPAPTHSCYTPPYSRVHCRGLCLKVKFCPSLRESLKVERSSVCISTLVSRKIKEYIKQYFSSFLCSYVPCRLFF
jgi:hypothetical protein